MRVRRILVDHARHERRVKRGGDATQISIRDVDLSSAEPPIDAVDALALDVLDSARVTRPRSGPHHGLRFFGGLRSEGTAAVMNVSTGTIKREWAVARAWLYRELVGDN
jgi:RNA polymerase sigma-70 factor, ECF subfamily